MSSKLFPKKEITIVSSLSKDRIIASLHKMYAGKRNVDFTYDANSFFIRRYVNNSSKSLILLNGSIVTKEGETSVNLSITMKDTYLVVFFYFWCSVNSLFFVLLIFTGLSTGNVGLSILIPIILLFGGYFLGPGNMRSEADGIAREIMRAIN